MEGAVAVIYQVTKALGVWSTNGEGGAVRNDLEAVLVVVVALSVHTHG